MGIFSKKRTAPQHLASLTSAGATYNSAIYKDFTEISLSRQDWQRRAFDIYDAEGHLFYATNYIGGAMARIQLVGATKPKSHGELEQPLILKTGPVADAIANIESPLGGQSGFLRQIGKNIFLTGEAWVIASAETYPDGSTSVNWDAVSIDELENNGTQAMRRRLPGAVAESLPKGSVTFRIWKEHPRFSRLADAGTRSCMEQLEKLIILNRAEKAIARSQLAGAGILALPQELVPPAWQNQGKEGNPMESNPLWQALAESMLAPLADEAAPSAVVPLLLVGPGAIIKDIKYEPMNRVFDTAGAQSSISNAIEQVANTLEIPKEILLGVGEATHWTAWSIREDVFQAHIQPLIELVCAGLTRTFMKQALAKFSDAQLKDAGIEDRDSVIVWYDASQLVIQPDKGDKMLGLHDRFVVTDEALARELGVPEADRLKTDSPEYAKRIGIKMADPGMALTGKPTPPPPPAAPGGGGAGPKGISPSRGKSPQGPGAAPAKLPSQRRAVMGLPQDSRTNTLRASAAESDAAALGRFDLEQLRKYRQMAERHLRSALQSVGKGTITAAADPGQFVGDLFLTEFAEAAAFTWADGTGLVSSLFGDLPNPIYESTITAAIKSSTNYYQELLRGLIGKKGFNPREPIFGEFITGEPGHNTRALVQSGDVRPLLVHLGGGSTDASVPLMGGITSGNTMREWLRSNGIDTKQKIWLYGFESEPRRTFNGHLQMDGLVFTEWNDDGLKIAPQDAWLRRTHYQPGDHWGCACVVAPWIPNFGDPYELETPTV